MRCPDRILDGCYAITVKKSFLISRRAVEEEGSDVDTQKLARDTSDGRLGERARRGEHPAPTSLDQELPYFVAGLITVPGFDMTEVPHVIRKVKESESLHNNKPIMYVDNRENFRAMNLGLPFLKWCASVVLISALGRPPGPNLLQRHSGSPQNRIPVPCSPHHCDRQIPVPDGPQRNLMMRRLQTIVWPYLRSVVLPSRPAQLLIQTGLKWDRDNCPGMAAALSYYALFSLFPLLLVILSIVGALIGPDTEAFRYIQSMMVRDLPPDVQSMVVGTIIALHETSVGAGIVGFMLLFFAASTLFAILRQSVNKIWESPNRVSDAGSVPKMVLFLIVNKLVAYLLVLGTALLLLTSLVANIFIRTVLDLLSRFQETFAWIQRVDELQLTRGLQIGSTIFILSLTLCVLFKVLPSVRPQWRDVWMGALMTAVLLAGLQQLATSSVVSVFSRFLSYGVIGSVMILMLWIFLACQIFFLGCEFSYAYANIYGSRRLAAKQALS